MHSLYIKKRGTLTTNEKRWTLPQPLDLSKLEGYYRIKSRVNVDTVS